MHEHEWEYVEPTEKVLEEIHPILEAEGFVVLDADEARDGLYAYPVNDAGEQNGECFYELAKCECGAWWFAGLDYDHWLYDPNT
jgi:hypothetical protein